MPIARAKRSKCTKNITCTGQLDDEKRKMRNEEARKENEKRGEENNGEREREREGIRRPAQEVDQQ